MAEEAVLAPRESLALQVLEKVSQLMTAAFGFVAALAWNDAVKTTIDTYHGAGGNLSGRFLYAVVVTVVAVLLALWIAGGINRVKRRMRRVPPATA